MNILGKEKTARLLAHILRAYYHVTWMPWQEWVWNSLVARHLLWRPLTFTCKTEFDAKIITTFPDTIQTRIFFFGFWEPNITSYVSSKLRPGDVFIDIGANIGYYSLLASRYVGQSGRVFAFEASPSIFTLLQKNLAANDATNVTARNVAVSDRQCEIPIFLNRAENIGASTTLQSVADSIGARQEATVNGYPLSDLVDLAVLRTARFIKIDVEGAEWPIVKGMRDVVSELSDDTEILIEINSSSAESLGGTAEDVLRIFLDAGFSPFEISNSYEIGPYIRREKPQLVPFDGKPFIQKDFVLKRVLA